MHKLLAFGLAIGLATMISPPRAHAADPAPAPKNTFVIVHGAWGGSWAFREVDHLLTADGNKVYRPALTGQGEKVHLASPQVGLTTHIQDVVNAILWEDLHDVILVGHSYGGMVVTGVADRIPGRIKRLIYLDAFLPENGESSLNEFALLHESYPKRDGAYPPTWVLPGTPLPHDVPMPERTFEEPLVLTNQTAALRIPTDYVLFLPHAGAKPADARFYPFYLRAKSRGWAIATLVSDHNAQWSHPREEAALLEKLAEQR